uniref:Protein-S-isoprenylcysteine O-methyltransferase Ste14 n=1 Tax=Candidatus Kentrum sp. TC TaxID=2126339 RepID=A0A450YU94_9GAMM|nr:MAG: Protein-S-isoprenylcysteine O-methyltransferase Ste14 [Candidatus Kentron sp. TC]VFK45096.1 MAG: Protein-S-isoprenylcysteine O-methyltransferase Ste14 [Candidatus Kentron sp. TC]VFK58267.1 MAG: Protein-S-isoprenylcysteine O-methyltransferase Ste14 [Candidatus Kentron sp. TC]
MTNLMIYAVAGLSLVLGFGSLIVFGVFLYTGSFSMLSLSLDMTGVLIFDTCLCLAFFLQHTGMTRIRAKNEILQKNFKIVFSIASGIVLSLFVILWQESSFLIASADGFLRGFMRTIFFLGVAGQIWSAVSLTSVDPFGVQELMMRLDPKKKLAPTTRLVSTKGAYGWVRHPAYSTMLMLIWSHPDPTADRLLLDVLFTSWIIIGAILEERDLVETFGEDYRIYQRTTPMLIPYRKPRRSKIQDG